MGRGVSQHVPGPIAFKVHSGLYQQDSIKLDKLRSCLTLHLFTLATEALPTERNLKMLYGFLPKAGAGDLILKVLSKRDREVLETAQQSPSFQAAVIEAVRQIVNDDARFLKDKTIEKHEAVLNVSSIEKGVGTPASKPIAPRAVTIRRGGLEKQRHLMVFEVRHPTDPLNVFSMKAKASANDITTAAEYQQIKAAQSPAAPRATKTMKPQK